MNKEIIKVLKELREKENNTQLELSEELGVSRSKISGWEIGRRNLTLDDSMVICEHYDLSLDYLLWPKKITKNKLMKTLEKYLENKKLSDTKREEIINKIDRILKSEIRESF